jgi:hypothetical protein
MLAPSREVLEKLPSSAKTRERDRAKAQMKQTRAASVRAAAIEKAKAQAAARKITEDNVRIVANLAQR